MPAISKELAMTDSKNIQTCYGIISKEIFCRLKKIRLLMLDVDGTLTDGGVYLDNTSLEFKKFNTKDGLGIAQLQKRSDCKAAVITGRDARLTERRCQECGITLLVQGQADKTAAAQKLIADLGISAQESAAVGDDLNDLSMFKVAGLTACPADASPYIRSYTDILLHRDGGRGAVREMCDLIMMAKGIMGTDGGIL
jgi:3-deoxy-D-manno-octulosonate 8-phosphate phosphatase (KDO 8-P phosphatase)